jgi:hypothetical protein
MALASVSLLLLSACQQPRVGVDVGIVFQGGPAPGNSSALQPGTVNILDAHGDVAASGRVHDGHVLHVNLSPGSYRVEAHSGDAQCVPRGLTVRDGSNASLHVLCSVR